MNGATDSADDVMQGPRRDAASLLDEIVEHGDENGAVANAEADELRDALALAADRLRVVAGRKPRGSWLLGVRRLTAEVWWLVDEHKIDARSRAADAALDMRDMIDSRWHPDIRTERFDGGAS